MKRLLLVSTVSATLRSFLLPFADFFRAFGWQVHALAQGASACPECIQAFDHVWDIQWSRNPLDPRNLLAAPSMIRDLVAREGYDLVHVHTPVAGFVTRYALRGLRNQGRVKVIYTAHGFHFYQGGPFLKNAIFRNIEKLAGRWTDCLVTINHQDEDAARRYCIVPPERLRYIPGIGIDTIRYKADAIPDSEVERVRRELGLLSRNSLFLMVAEFNPGKRHRDTLKAFSRLGRPDAHLAFAGEGPLQSATRQLVSELGLDGRVHFLGFRKDISSLIRASTAVLLPSEREGLPRSIMESLSLEVPVIGTDIRGIRDLLEGGGGLLVKVGDVDGLIQAMGWLLDHPTEAKIMGKCGRERMAVYDILHILRMHEELYAEALREDE